MNLVATYRDMVQAPQACHVRVRERQSGERLALHGHDYHHVSWIERGQAIEVLPDGRKRTLPRGSLILVRQSDRHGFDTDEGYRIVNVIFDELTWRYLVERYFGRDGDLLARPVEARTFHLTTADQMELWRLSAEVRRDQSRLALERFLLNLWQFLADRRPARSPDALPHWLQRAVDGLRDPDVLEEGTAAFVEMADRTPEHVAREARRLLGKTPTELVNEARLEWAASRLRESDDDIIEISLACGFQSLSHFYRLFRSRFGQSPARFRGEAAA